MEREKSAGAVIFRREGGNIYYLLLHYESGHWDFPKGHIESEEEIRETVLREVKEETGLEDIKFIPEFEEKIQYFFRRSYNQKTKPNKRSSTRLPLIFKRVFFYLTETKNKDIRISHEHSDFKWLLYEEALKKTTYKNTKDILRKAHQFLLEHEIKK